MTGEELRSMEIGDIGSIKIDDYSAYTVVRVMHGWIYTFKSYNIAIARGGSCQLATSTFIPKKA